MEKKLTCNECDNFKANGLDEKTCSVNVIGSIEDVEKCSKFKEKKMTFKKEFLQSMVWDDNPNTKVIKDELVEVGRWSILHSVIFKYEDKFYKSHYRVGATEMQEESPYEYENDEIKCEEVFPVEKKCIVYLTKNETEKQDE